MTSAAERRLLARVALPWPASAESAATDAIPNIAPWAILSAAIIPVLLNTGWLAADALQPPSYSPVRQTVSVMSGYAGTDRWVVTTALYLAGVAYFVTAAGMKGVAVAARAGLVIAGAAAIGVASFPQPVHGTSREHAVCTGIGAVAITVWPALAARRDTVLAAVGARKSFLAVVASFALFLWTAVETRNGAHLGLAERMSSGLQVTWPCAVALSLRRARIRGQVVQV